MGQTTTGTKILERKEGNFFGDTNTLDWAEERGRSIEYLARPGLVDPFRDSPGSFQDYPSRIPPGTPCGGGGAAGGMIRSGFAGELARYFVPLSTFLSREGCRCAPAFPAPRSPVPGVSGKTSVPPGREELRFIKRADIHAQGSD